MKKFKITNKKEKTWQDKKFVEADLTDEEDNLYERVSAWSGEFSGDIFEGELEKSPKGYWKIKKDKTANTNFRSQQMEKVMDRKEQSIGRTMDRKEESIALAGAQRDAVLIVVNLFGASQGYDEIEIKANVVKWRNWFLSDEFRTPPPF